MNILPKKSWHVRNKDNVARVRRDEAQAAEEERQRRKRAELAEQEARTDFLRKKSRLSLPEASTTERSAAAVELSEESGHINFFQNVEEGKGTTRGNKEYEEEKRKEKERQEKALGILTYLGQSAAEAQTCRPWYQEVPAHRKEKEETAKDEKLKGMLDPMKEMEKYLRKKTGEKKRHSDKKEHKKAKEKGDDKKGASKPSMEQLRQERLKREAAERARAAALLSGKKEPAAPEQEMDDRKRRYNSQFNPQLARKPKVREEQW